MKVYLLEVGCYDDRDVVGVFASPQAAMAAHNPESRGQVLGREYGRRAGQPWTYEWSGPDDHGWYRFDADWDDAAGITEYEVQHLGADQQTANDDTHPA